MRGSRDPRTAIHAAAGRDSERKAKNQVRPAREALRVGIEQQDGQGDGRKLKREPVQLARGQNEDQAGNDDEGCDECGRKMSGGQGAGAGARVGGVNRGVGPAVKSHGGGPRSNHGNHDPDQLMNGRQSPGREHGAAEREWQREHGVLPLDHLQRHAQVVKDRHATIVKQGLIGSPVSALVGLDGHLP